VKTYRVLETKSGRWTEYHGVLDVIIHESGTLILMGSRKQDFLGAYGRDEWTKVIPRD